jgi:hypothetical protein
VLKKHSSDAEQTRIRKLIEAVSLVRCRGLSIDDACEIVIIDPLRVRRYLKRLDSGKQRAKLDPNVPTPSEIVDACKLFRLSNPRLPLGFSAPGRVELTRYRFDEAEKSFALDS